jgi:phosphate transport system substrate-binding protein
MTRTRIVFALATTVAGMALLAAACGNAPDQQQTVADADGEGTSQSDGGANGDGGGDGDQLSGSIEIDGSSTVGPLTDAIAEEYAAGQPDVTVNLSISGTGGGFERFCGTGDTHISNASRPIKDEEAERCEENGIDYIQVRVGTDALTMVTNPKTEFVDCLTREEVVQIWGPDGVDSWSEVREEFPDEDIEIFAPGADSGTYDFFNETVLEPSDIEQPRQDYNGSEDDNVIAQGIIGTPASWGFFGYAYYQQNTDQLRAISYDAGDGCVEPSAETAQDDSYKLARPLFIYVKKSALAEPHVADFVTFYLDTVGDVIDDVGYIPASDNEIDEARQEVEQAIEAAG